MRHFNYFALLFIFVLTLPVEVHSFIENVTHGYPACITCHVSPSGGGLLTDYGRALSNEVLSTWTASENFAQPLFGAVKNTENVQWGGDFRTIQTYLDNANVKKGQLFVMQQNVEVGVITGSVQFVATAGTQEGPKQMPGRGEFLSERHYVLWTPAENSRLRVGKFRQNYGMNTPIHTRLIKSRFGFGALSETYNMEFSQFFEKYEISVTSSLGRIDKPRDPNSERNISGQFVHYLNGSARLGASVLLGESAMERRTLAGIHGAFPIGEHFIGLFELDYKYGHYTTSPQQPVNAFASFVKLGHRPFNGAMTYLLYEHYSESQGSNYNLTQSPGIGLQWLPLTHFNIQAEFLNRTTSSNSGNSDKVAWLLFQFYI